IGQGALHRFHHGAHTVVLEDLGIPNGIAFPGDGSALLVDSAENLIWRFPGAAGGDWKGRRVFRRFTAGDGTPDGLCLDATGGVWVALWGGSRVERYSPTGALTAVVEVSGTQPTGCAFGGLGRGRLYITTSSYGLDDS